MRLEEIAVNIAAVRKLIDERARFSRDAFDIRVLVSRFHLFARAAGKQPVLLLPGAVPVIREVEHERAFARRVIKHNFNAACELVLGQIKAYAE